MRTKLKSGTKAQINVVKQKFWRVAKILPTSIYYDAVALYYYMLDSDVPWYKKAFVVGCLIYIINPFDAIPDVAPVVGFTDDAALILATRSWLGSELQDYY